jgi:hypothetical protein
VSTPQPTLVVEIALDGVQSSTRYPGGLALRYARVTRYRPDKEPWEADTIDDLRALLGHRSTIRGGGSLKASLLARHTTSRSCGLAMVSPGV